jgi:hypothetical protein
MFMRLEYALKATEYVHNPDEPEAQWDRFANEMRDLRQYGDTRVADAIKLFDEDPPKKQVIRNSELTWENHTPLPRTNATLFVHVRRVRNNLFHGSKFPWMNRDEQLLRAAEAIMIAGLSLNDRVTQKFLEPPSEVTF